MPAIQTGANAANGGLRTIGADGIDSARRGQPLAGSAGYGLQATNAPISPLPKPVACLSLSVTAAFVPVRVLLRFRQTPRRLAE